MMKNHWENIIKKYDKDTINIIKKYFVDDDDIFNWKYGTVKQIKDFYKENIDKQYIVDDYGITLKMIYDWLKEVDYDE